MVHPGIIVAGVFGVVLTGVVIYEMFKEEFSDFLESFEKPSPVGYGYERPRDQRDEGQRGQRGFAQDEHDHRQGHSSSMYQADYELRQRRTLRDDDDEKEDEADHDILMERLRKINETEAAIAANEARLANMERAMKEREEALERSTSERVGRLEQELRESNERNARREQELNTMHQLQQQQQQQVWPDMRDQNPFASVETLHQPVNVNRTMDTAATPETMATTSNVQHGVDSRAANAILRHDLSSNHLDHVSPFEDPASLHENASSSLRSSVNGDETDGFTDAEDRSLTVGRDEDDQDWTEAEIGSIGSHESEESWGSP
ncbi:hypothetical protein BGZ72_000607 [Mortierella alpina]|nr:hypothetical protein BGZ72_000607 [Mortierella alpina]